MRLFHLVSLVLVSDAANRWLARPRVTVTIELESGHVLISQVVITLLPALPPNLRRGLPSARMECTVVRGQSSSSRTWWRSRRLQIEVEPAFSGPLLTS